jgi:uncharacterized protein YkwD
VVRIAAAALLIGVAYGPSLAFGEGPDLARVETMIVDATNQLRHDRGVGRVEWDPQLEHAARDFARYMARTDHYGHEADGKTPAQRARVRGYDYCLVAENIAYQFSSAGFGTNELAHRTVEGWKKSAGHRENMLEPTALDTAVAVAQSEKTGRYYAVQMFGRPRSAGCRRSRG